MADPRGITFEQVSRLHARKDNLKETHVKYIEHHPELKQIMADFLSRVLLDKPDDIRAFAKEHFAAYLPPAPLLTVRGCALLALAVPRGLFVRTLLARKLGGVAERLSERHRLACTETCLNGCGIDVGCRKHLRKFVVIGSKLPSRHARRDGRKGSLAPIIDGLSCWRRHMCRRAAIAEDDSMHRRRSGHLP